GTKGHLTRFTLCMTEIVQTSRLDRRNLVCRPKCCNFSEVNVLQSSAHPVPDNRQKRKGASRKYERRLPRFCQGDRPECVKVETAYLPPACGKENEVAFSFVPRCQAEIYRLD